ncbi:MAG: ComEC/Rec2 family competence protein [Clostridia bacterium]|nr:ComEC/Rec2 family competence protein [Clostridia bacterium]
MLVNRPILCAAIGYIIGIIMGLYCKISIVLLYLVIIPIFKIFDKKRKQKFKLISFRRYFRYVKIIFSSNVIKIMIIFSVLSNSIVLYQNNKYEKLYQNLNNDNISVTAKVISNVKEKDYKDTYILKIDKVNGDTKYENTRVYLNIKKSLNLKLEYGSIISLDGIFAEPEGRRNYRGFNYKEYLKTLKIYGTVDLEKVNGNFGVKKSIFTISNNVFLKIKNLIQQNFSENIANVILGITIGYTDCIEEEIKENFRNSNISHILAISGMHVGYITICAKFIFDKILGKRKSKIVTSVILIIYMFITRFAPSVVRGVVMAIISIMSGVFHGKSDTWENIGLSLMLLLLYNPFLIESISVLLSFGGTIGIIILQKNVKSITLSATLFIMPIVGIYFNQVTILSLIINIIVGVIIGPIIILCFGFIVFAKMIDVINLGFITKIYVSIITFLLNLLIDLASIGNKIPLNKIYITTPNVLGVVIYYSIILIR